MASSKYPPRFDGSEYETWKKDINIWCALTELDENKQALAIHLSLSGRARTASSEIELAVLKSKDGVKRLLDKLDSLFLADKGRRQFTAFQNLYNLRRNNKDVHEYVSEFEHKYFKFTKEEMTLPDSVLAFMLLAACNLPGHETQIVMSAISEVNYANMKSTLKRVFGQQLSMQSPQESNTEIGAEGSSVIKAEPVFCSDSNEEVYYASRGGRPRRPSSGYRPRYRGRGRGAAMVTSSGFGNQGTNRRLNPLDQDGKVSRCVICDSRYHWARFCPHSYENNEALTGGVKEIDASNSSEDHVIHMSLFVGYAGEKNIKQTKIGQLIEESRQSGIVDTGCSTTVCGQQWLDTYLGSLCDEELSMVREEKSSATFTFGDGVKHRSIKRIVFPCWIGGIRSELSTDVVECSLPLLISRHSMKKGKMVLDFDKDSIRIMNRWIKLIVSSSGHYLLPLYL